MPNAVKSRLKRHEWRALGLCILISATIWLLRALNAPATGVVELKVKYAGDSDCAVARCVPPIIEVEIEAAGFEVLGQSIVPRTRVLNLTTESLVKRGEARYAMTASLKKDLRMLIGADCEVISVSTDSILIHCEAP